MQICCRCQHNTNRFFSKNILCVKLLNFTVSNSDITYIKLIKFIYHRYLAAPGQINNVNIYNEASPYEEIEEDYLEPEVSNRTETNVKEDETEEYSEDVDHYLELE